MKRISDLKTHAGVQALVGRMVAQGAATAAVGLIGNPKKVLALGLAGRKRGPASGLPTVGSLFDLASLSKPLTATLALALEANGALPWRTELGEIWREAAEDMRRVRLEHLLRHRSGLLPWAPLYEIFDDRKHALSGLLDGGFLGARSGAYSDLGYILWTGTAERALGRPLESLIREEVLLPLGLLRQVRGSAPDPRRLVGCDIEPHKENEMAKELGYVGRLERHQWGEVQDGNARWWGRPVGHSGFFGSAAALWRLGVEWLRPQWLPSALVARAVAGKGRLRLGWWSRRVRGAAGGALSASSFGHTGFTGGSVWVDPERERVFVLLAHRRSDSVDLDPWRRELHRLG